MIIQLQIHVKRFGAASDEFSIELNKLFSQRVYLIYTGKQVQRSTISYFVMSRLKLFSFFSAWQRIR